MVLNRREADLEAWNKWKANPTPQNQQVLLNVLDPLITSEVNKLTGLNPTKRSALKVRAKMLTIEALKTYDPSKSQMNTYLVGQLMKLKRFAYENAGIARIPENRQLKIREYKDAINSFNVAYDRDPTDNELASKLGWPLIEVQKMKKQVRSEIPMSLLVYNPAIKGQDSKIQRTIELMYDSLDKRDQDIFDYTLGTHGKTALTNNDISRKLNISPGLVSQRKTFIANKLQASGISKYNSETLKTLMED